MAQQLIEVVGPLVVGVVDGGAGVGQTRGQVGGMHGGAGGQAGQGGQGGYNRPPGSRSPLGRQYY